MDRVVVAIIPRPRRRGDSFMHLFMDAVGELARQRLRPTTWRVLAYLLSTLEWGNWLGVRQVDVARALGLCPDQVSRAFRDLRDLGLLIEDVHPKTGQRGLRLCPWLAWRGSVRLHREVTGQLLRRPDVPWPPPGARQALPARAAVKGRPAGGREAARSALDGRPGAGFENQPAGGGQ